MKDVICVDGEMEIVVQEILDYLSFIIKEINLYNCVLKRVQMVGIKDELIRSKVGNLSKILNEYKSKMKETLENIQNDKQGFLREIEINDKFDFPYGGIEQLKAMINLFN